MTSRPIAGGGTGYRFVARPPTPYLNARIHERNDASYTPFIIAIIITRITYFTPFVHYTVLLRYIAAARITIAILDPL